MGTVVGSITEYGSYIYRQAIFRDGPVAFTIDPISISIEEVELRFYNVRGEIGRVSTGTGKSALGKVKFEYLPTGCGKLDFTLLNPPPFIIDPGMRVDVHAFRDPIPWYSGLVLNKPALGSTNRNLKFEGHGWFDVLEHVIFHNNDGTKNTKFQNTEVATIVVSLFQDFISPLGSVVFNPGKIVPAGYIAIDTDFELATAKEAFEDLAALAFNYEIGIDEQRNFFFRPISDVIQFSRFVTKHADTITVEENFGDMANRLYVKHALTVNSETVHNIFVKEDTTSQAVYGVREKHVTAPTIVDTIDAERWAQFKLNEIKNPIRKARIKGTDITTKYIVHGNCRIFALQDEYDYSDEFAKAIFHSDWRVERNVGNSPAIPALHTLTTSLNVAIGMLQLEVHNNGSTINTLYENVFVYKTLQGDFDVITSIGSGTGGVGVGVDGSYSGIHIRESKNSWVIIGQEVLEGTTDTIISRVDTTDQVSVGTGAGSWGLRTPYAARIRREGKVFKTWVGTDSINWTAVTAPTSPFLYDGPVQVGFMASDGNDTQGYRYRFDNFIVDKFAEPYSLPIKKITYQWDDKQRKVDIEIGDFKESLDKEFIELKRDIQTQELLQEKV